MTVQCVEEINPVPVENRQHQSENTALSLRESQQHSHAVLQAAVISNTFYHRTNDLLLSKRWSDTAKIVHRPGFGTICEN